MRGIWASSASLCQEGFCLVYLHHSSGLLRKQGWATTTNRIMNGWILYQRRNWIMKWWHKPKKIRRYTKALRNQLANRVPRLLPTQKAMNLLIVNLTRCWHDTQVWHDGGGGRVRFVAHNICSCIFVAASIDFLCSPIIRVGCMAGRSPWNSSVIGCIKIPAFSHG